MLTCVLKGPQCRERIFSHPVYLIGFHSPENGDACVFPVSLHKFSEGTLEQTISRILGPNHRVHFVCQLLGSKGRNVCQANLQSCLSPANVDARMRSPSSENLAGYTFLMRENLCANIEKETCGHSHNFKSTTILQSNHRLQEFPNLIPGLD